MRLRKQLLAALALALVLPGCGGAPAPGAAEQIVLTYASPYPPGHPFSRADISWMKFVEQRSGGRVRIQPFWSGALLSSEQSMEEIRHGVADIGLITPIYARGGAHTVRAQAGFYGGVASMEDQVAIYKCLAARFPQFSHDMAGLHVLAVQGGNFPGIATRTRPVRSLADLRGLRLRAPNENLELLRGLGADPVNMPMGEVYSALAKGVIDGVVAPGDTLRSLHLAEVAPYFSTIRFARGAYPARAMAARRWGTLAPDIRAILTEGQGVWEAALHKEIIAAERTGLDFGATHKVHFVGVSPAEQRRLDTLYNANGLRIARDLSRFGSEGEPIFREAQRLIAQAAAGTPPACPAGATTL